MSDDIFLKCDAFQDEDISSDDDVNDKAYANLIKDISSITGKKRLTASKTVRAASSSSATIRDAYLLNKITNKEIKKKSKNLKPLEKPLEKPAANRIRRAAGYEKVSIEVNKWEKLVYNRRKKDQLTFPLQEADVRIQTTEKLAVREPKTSLQKQVYELLHGARLVKKKETEVERKMKDAMTLQEVKEQNREMWRARELKLRMERKAARQNANKSRKYRKILKKERLKKQKAELEALMNADPALALEKLKELDDVRIQERMNLRHRRSKWAHLQGLRAAHDKNSLTAIQENRRLHNELKQKHNNIVNKELEEEEMSKEDDNENNNNNDDTDPSNPWSSSSNKPDAGVDNISYSDVKNCWDQVKPKEKPKSFNNERKQNKTDAIDESKLCKTVDVDEIDKIFDTAEDQVQRKLKRRIKHIDYILDRSPVKRKKVEKGFRYDPKAREHDFTCNNEEENLDETTNKKNNNTDEPTLEVAVQDLKLNSQDKEKSSNSQAKSIIDPKAFMEVKSKTLTSVNSQSTNLGTEVLDDEDGESDEDAEHYIHDALADDYLIEDFKTDKQSTVDKNKKLIETLAMPGWGDWSGPGIQMSKRKMKRFRIRTPKAPPRKDSNIGNVIYNEESDVHDNLRKVMVSELPYPFTSVKDFEASIRAPIGRNFVPENVHRKLIAPPVVTKSGIIIEPMSEEELLSMKDLPVKDDTRHSAKKNKR